MKTIFFWILDKTNFISFGIFYCQSNIIIRLFNNKNLYIPIKANVFIFNSVTSKFKILKTKNLFEFYNSNEISLELYGLGYNIYFVNQSLLELSLGYSHKIFIKLPKHIGFIINKTNTKITFKTFDKNILNTIAAKFKMLRKANPYKEKGIKKISEILNTKNI